MTDAGTHTLSVPGATLTYDERENATSHERPLMLIGSPMGASGFGTLADLFADRTVITYDPRGSERSTKDDPAAVVDPNDHAEDVHRVIQATGGGPVDMFASSGGAINALALVAKYPNDVHTLVAHEPPLAGVLPDAEHATAAVRAIHGTYEQRGFGAGMAHFIAITSQRGPMTAEIAAQPGPDPQMFGMPTHDDGKRTDPLLGPSMVAMTTTCPTGTRCVPLRHASCSARAMPQRVRWPTVAPMPWLIGWAQGLLLSPAATAASIAASGSRATRTHSRPRYAGRLRRASRERLRSSVRSTAAHGANASA